MYSDIKGSASNQQYWVLNNLTAHNDAYKRNTLILCIIYMYNIQFHKISISNVYTIISENTLKIYIIFNTIKNYQFNKFTLFYLR